MPVIVTNSYAGTAAADPEVEDAARGVGTTGRTAHRGVHPRARRPRRRHQPRRRPSGGSCGGGSTGGPDRVAAQWAEDHGITK
ncbi:hypothetical protein GCM10012280_28460 [Wenjunlia tyrosinilytica]|uniref:Uncharacterized protein n=1 Tax=Wenjunlia tyrosinilytica TaxID=1544741 RepID=A0A918DXA0_9ACTN|nr:hypothetical protein GCM10012280_28460 [Wenjunlia tyrosinilytica]